MNSRQKGKRGELELAAVLRAHGYDTRRGQQYAGANGDADVVGLPGVHIECKRVERLDLDGAMAQSVRDARAGEVPVVMHRRNRGAWLVTMRLEDWLDERADFGADRPGQESGGDCSGDGADGPAGGGLLQRHPDGQLLQASVPLEPRPGRVCDAGRVLEGDF